MSENVDSGTLGRCEIINLSLRWSTQGQKYYRAGGDSGGDREPRVFPPEKRLDAYILILLRKSVVAWAGFEPATLGL